jgi:hypothetical protein
LEEQPHARKAQLPCAGYEFSTVVEGNQLAVNRSLRLEKSFFPLQGYAQLKNLFDIVQAGDASQAVLQLMHAASLPNLE